MNPVFLSDSVFLHFGTSSATTGAATNADSTPTVVVAEDGTDLGYAPTVTNVATGLYKVELACTSGNGFEAGRRYSAYVVATVGGITGRDGLGEFEVLAVDLNTGVASVTGAVASVAGQTLANLDVAVSTRLSTAGYVAPDNASITTILSDTNDIQTRLPVALVGGRMDSSVGSNLDKAGYSISGTKTTLDALNDITAASVWAVGTRLLTAGTNIVLAKGVGVTGFNDIAATDVVSAGAITTSAGKVSSVASVDAVVGLTPANLDVAVSTRLATAGYTVPDNASISAIKGKTDNLTFTTVGVVDSNVRRVADTEVTGVGTADDPWGP